MDSVNLKQLQLLDKNSRGTPPRPTEESKELKHWCSGKYKL